MFTLLNSHFKLEFRMQINTFLVFNEYQREIFNVGLCVATRVTNNNSPQ